MHTYRDITIQFLNFSFATQNQDIERNMYLKLINCGGSWNKQKKKGHLWDIEGIRVETQNRHPSECLIKVIIKKNDDNNSNNRSEINWLHVTILAPLQRSSPRLRSVFRESVRVWIVGLAYHVANFQIFTNPCPRQTRPMVLCACCCIQCCKTTQQCWQVLKVCFLG